MFKYSQAFIHSKIAVKKEYKAHVSLVKIFLVLPKKAIVASRHVKFLKLLQDIA
jgi:hypothetical protein